MMKMMIKLCFFGNPYIVAHFSLNSEHLHIIARSVEDIDAAIRAHGDPLGSTELTWAIPIHSKVVDLAALEMDYGYTLPLRVAHI